MEASTLSTTSKRPVTGILFFVSFLTLFLELALIRWVSSEIRIFAYFKNLVLIACFLGFGAGCFFYRRMPNFLLSMVLLLLLSLPLRVPWAPLKTYGPQGISGILAEMPGIMVFGAGLTTLSWMKIPALLFALGWTLVLFFLLAKILEPFGQVIAASMSAIEDPIRAYSINIAGSLAGTLAFSVASALTLPPVCWFAPVGLGCALITSGRTRKSLLLATAGLLLLLSPFDNDQKKTYWSSYQKLEVVGNHIYVNNIGYHSISLQPDFAKLTQKDLNGVTLPYVMRLPPGRVLIVGAGSGNDAAAALRAGATSVTAVEIDDVIVDIGRRLHPQHPYDDPRVQIIVDDARHFLHSNQEKFDLIVFSHLDSHTLLSSYTNVRLDDYIYTVNSLKEARKHLAPNGILFLAFFSQQPYVPARLANNLFQAFGHGPFLSIRQPLNRTLKVQLSYFVTAEPDVMPKLERSLRNIPDQFGQIKEKNPGVRVTDDNWPFLPLSHPHIPTMVLILSLMILVICAVLTLKARPPGEAFDGQMFWLGAAFLLMEVHNVSRLALLFGVTWQVNAWVIGTILTVILLANWLTSRFFSKLPGIHKWMYIGLFASLIVAYFIPMEFFLKHSHLAGVIATLILTLPIFFAALVFADAFSKSKSPGFALGWNILGAAVGGMVESLSYLIGIPNLVLVALIFYACAFLWRIMRLKKFQEQSTVSV